MSRDTAITNLDVAQAALAECKTVMEAKQIADVAEAARTYLARTNASVETVNRATEVRLLAERQMGEFLERMPKAGPEHYTGGGSNGSHREPLPDAPPTLREIGITKKQSATAQRLAAIPKEEFEERVAVAKADGGKLSVAKVLNPPVRQPEPIRHRRRVPPFDFEQWKDHKRITMGMWFRPVPEALRREAYEFLAQLAQELSQNNEQ